MAKQLSMEDLIKKYKYLKCLRDTDDRVKSDERNLKKSDETLMNHSKSSPESRHNSDMPKRSSSTVPPDEQADDDTCKVCMDARVNCAFIECGHLATCLNCATLLTKCPICRETIKKILRIYKS